MKVALIHDHLAQDGGAERVLQVLSKIFPQAVIYTLLYDRKNVVKNFKKQRIETSIIQKLPGGVRHYKWYLGLMPMAVEFFDLRSFDLVISDTSSFAKGVITPPDTPHICYCHTPTRYLWSDTHQYISELKYNKFFKKIISLVLNRLRVWDLAAASRVDHFIANSETVKRRIKKYYRRESTVIYPPVNTDKFYISDLSYQKKSDRYFLAGCRLAPYKRLDILIKAFKQLGSDYRLKIFGDGIDLKRLVRLAKGADNIEFLGRVDDQKLADLYSYCLAYLNPQEEDFGITAVEAMASGRPVIALSQGGALETVNQGESGIFFSEQSTWAVKEAVEKFIQDLDNGRQSWDSATIRRQAERFTVARFEESLREFIQSKTNFNL